MVVVARPLLAPCLGAWPEPRHHRQVASDQEQLIIAETAVKEAEDRLRTLIFDTSDRSVWNVNIEPIDSPPVGLMTPDIDAAVRKSCAILRRLVAQARQ